MQLTQAKAPNLASQLLSCSSCLVGACDWRCGRLVAIAVPRISVGGLERPGLRSQTVCRLRLAVQFIDWPRLHEPVVLIHGVESRIVRSPVRVFIKPAPFPEHVCQ